MVPSGSVREVVLFGLRDTVSTCLLPVPPFSASRSSLVAVKNITKITEQATRTMSSIPPCHAQISTDGYIDRRDCINTGPRKSLSLTLSAKCLRDTRNDGRRLDGDAHDTAGMPMFRLSEERRDIIVFRRSGSSNSWPLAPSSARTLFALDYLIAFALDCLIGEKLLSFAVMAGTRPEFARDLPRFVVEVRVDQALPRLP
jgi:hypothetical protein